MHDNVKQTKPIMTVLCVDDEKEILQSIKRLLHKQRYQLLLATSADSALELLLQHNVDLVISDMRMPKMSGAELLEKVATSYPNSHRILLTGYADNESTISAVNNGKIHKYLQKPWDNTELIGAIEDGLEKVNLKYENIKLQKFINEQNESLKELNKNLESKVQLRTRQIHTALSRMKRNNHATQSVLYNLVNINPNLISGFSNSVSLLAKRIAKKLSLSIDEINEITYAASLCEIGLLGLDRTISSKPFDQLNYNQKQEYLGQTKIAQLVLGPAVHLQTVSDIIACQFEYCNGTGPQKFVGSQIPIGAKILSVARDYWRYALGRITAHSMNKKEVQAEMRKFTGTRYDPAVLEILFNIDDIVSDEFMEKSIPTEALLPGMVLKYNLFTNTHILVLPEGHVFSESTIAKLKQFEKSQAKSMSLIIEDQYSGAKVLTGKDKLKVVPKPISESTVISAL